jgi:DNA-binding NarL/FixJ family response regulator
MINKKLNIIITDDHPIVTTSLKEMFGTFLNIVNIDIANNGDELLNLLKKRIVDIVILDINMPGKDGIELASIIRTNYKNTKIMILSSFISSEYVNQCYEVKVDAFINKSSSTNEIIEGINQVIKGEKYYSNDIKDILLNNLINKDQHNKQHHKKDSLSLREIEVLRLICQKKNYKQIAEILFISENTVRKHRQNLMAKTSCHSTSEIFEYAIKHKMISLPNK